ncbi:hypothetical protein S-PM2d078 [Synechococcus phage S-PM2]|uniref:Hypothetical-Protein / belonging to T4-LIKE GC: 825 n=1 Tax=Synechococcus phage S-PM2 TaxID=238854 RepID=Q5GQU2_BPSYP|nr:Hypothetical-Protein / belonging to T4-LIKE GC: 825 [Synechococcus phage S-PM2]CAF34142.1 Hypothetical-Protein / belonging to T4-LIKE GC: 825 [Synechococcus phage S-PM2]CFW42204.1 hypothetical protein S-PM2d078 [Synechococcus phage S-PM2]
MAKSPTDLGNEFVRSGMTLISQPASDRWIKKAKVDEYKKPPQDRLSRPCGGSGGFDDYVERWHE